MHMSSGVLAFMMYSICLGLSTVHTNLANVSVKDDFEVGETYPRAGHG